MKQVVFQAIILSLPIACGAYEGETTSYADVETEDTELGTLEQPIWAASGGTYTHGTCNNRNRDKCSWQAACPGSVACIVPATKTQLYVLKGIDTPVDPMWDSWKFEFRRVFGELERLHSPWVGQEVAEAQANVVITRGTCSCATPTCDTMADLACFQEPTGLGLVTLTESLPGTYVRPASATQKRFVFVDIAKLLTLAQFEGSSGRHFAMEHLSRWVVGTLLGVGSETGWRGTVFAQDEWWANNVMAPFLSTSQVIAVHEFNFENQFEPAEACLLEYYGLSNPTTYQLAPVGCQ